MLAGTVFSQLHQPDSWDYTWKQVTDVAALTQAVGGEHIVVIPERVARRQDRRAEGEPRPDRRAVGAADQPDRRAGPTDPATSTAWHVQFHSHADSHVGYQPEIERFLEATDPDYVNLCLDTGHVAYYGGDSLELITEYPERIGYVHLKQVNPG